MPAKYPVIDYHTHFFPEYLKTVLEIMDENGIERAVNLGLEYELVEALLESYQALHPDRFAVFTTPDFSKINRPDFATFLAEDLERKVEKGAKGLKIFKQLGLTIRDSAGRLLSVNDPRLDLLWEKAGELGVPVSIHIADPKAFFSPPTPENPEYEVLQIFPEWSFYGDEFPSWDELLEDQRKLVKSHPKTTFVCVHFGNASEDLSYVGRLLDENPNVYIDTAARACMFGAHGASKVRDFFIKYQDRILFGTDFGVGPITEAGIFWLGVGDGKAKTREDCRQFFEAHWRYYETAEKAVPRPCPITGKPTLEAINLPGEVLEKFYYKNARRLIPGWQR